MPSAEDYPAAEYEPAIIRAVSRLTSAQLNGSRDEDDLRQEARIAVWRAHQRAGGMLDEALVYTIAYRRGIDYVRQHRRTRAGYARQPLSLDWQVDRVGHDVCLADDDIAAAMTAMDLRAAIEELPSPRHRRFVALVLYDGLSVRDAGLALGYAARVGIHHLVGDQAPAPECDRQRGGLMPSRSSRLCASCRRIVPAGPCPHCSSGWAERPPASWSRTSGRKGSRRWRSVRAMRLQLTPYCQMCGRLATIADHLDGTDYDDDSGAGRSWLNLDMTRPLCASCHGARTARQGNRAARGLPPPESTAALEQIADRPYEI